MPNSILFFTLCAEWRTLVEVTKNPERLGFVLTILLLTPFFSWALCTLSSIAAHAQRESRRTASIRRIAIVLLDLPAATAAKLLAELPPGTRQRVQHESATLVDVDPVERRRALESFAASLRQAPIDPVTRTPSALEFLDELSDDGLLALLRDEHPQTKAVVLAEIPPPRAASLLPRLSAEQRQDVMARIGRLPDVSEDMLNELAQSFRSRVDRLTSDHPHRSPGKFNDRQTCGLTDDAMSSSAFNGATANTVSPRLQAILAEMPAASSTNSRSDSGTSRSDSSVERLRQVMCEQAPAAPTASISVEQIHRDLMRLSPAKLCESLGGVDTRTAILALCGLPSHVADAAIACLPRSQANQVRQHLMSVGRLEIREIDQAKATVAAAARVAGQSSPSGGDSAAAGYAAPPPSQGHVAVAM